MTTVLAAALKTDKLAKANLDHKQWFGQVPKNGKPSDMFISSYFSNFCNTLFSFGKIKPWVTIGFDYALEELELEATLSGSFP